MLENLQKHGLNFIQFAHENNCPTIASWNMDECTCGDKVDVTVHQDEAEYERTFNHARRWNRKARRAAERAMWKAAKTKAARATGTAFKSASTYGNCSTNKKGGAA